VLLKKALSSGLFNSAAAIKGQIDGPITLSAYRFYKDRPFLSDPALFAAIAFHVSQIICWQIDRLKSAGLPTDNASSASQSVHDEQSSSLIRTDEL
jgi:hypothetical protein